MIGKREKTKRTLDAEATKEKIFQAAVELFAQYGYDIVTISDITKRAGVSKGSFYTHFESKDAVLVEQFNKIDECYEQAFAEISDTLSASEMLSVLLTAMVRYCEEVCGINVIKIVYMNQIGLQGRKIILVNKKRPFYAILRNIVIRGRDTGELPDRPDVEELIESVAKSIRGIIFEWCLYNGTLEMDCSENNARAIINSIKTYFQSYNETEPCGSGENS